VPWPSRDIAMSPVGYISPSSLTPTLPGSSYGPRILPPLPKIQSGQIWKRIFTHSSSVPNYHKHSFQAPEGDPPVDNEEFVHLGDQVFALAVTDAIQERYPYLRVGPASKVRDRIKRRGLLAEICMSYGLHMTLNVSGHQASDLRASQSVQADVFKAYVGGVYRDQGADVVSSWLISVLRPHIKAAYRIVRDDYLLLPHEAPADAFGAPSRRVVTDRPHGRRRRRRSDSGDGRSDDTGDTSPQRLLWTVPDSINSTRKRLRVEGTYDK